MQTNKILDALISKRDAINEQIDSRNEAIRRNENEIELLSVQANDLGDLIDLAQKEAGGAKPRAKVSKSRAKPKATPQADDNEERPF